jgi:hypothetical protein
MWIKDFNPSNAAGTSSKNGSKNNDQEYTKLTKSIEDKVRDSLSYKKRFIELAIFSD